MGRVTSTPQGEGKRGDSKAVLEGTGQSPVPSSTTQRDISFHAEENAFVSRSISPIDGELVTSACPDPAKDEAQDLVPRITINRTG